jgi:hypothetical protein
MRANALVKDFATAAGRAAAGHRGLMLAALMVAAHLSISLRSNFCRLADERRSGATTVAPSCFNRSATAGVSRVALTAPCSFSTMAAGVSFGRSPRLRWRQA